MSSKKRRHRIQKMHTSSISQAFQSTSRHHHYQLPFPYYPRSPVQFLRNVITNDSTSNTNNPLPDLTKLTSYNNVHNRRFQQVLFQRRLPARLPPLMFRPPSNANEEKSS
uniref:Uncharacterized protein n=1 Tax=Physcomitrium patens TaxID=3218 RepID=A0A2K1ISJ8_PHYPA|nr:hypothetical protein PHYPA_026382 [Physcomitrium patens]